MCLLTGLNRRAAHAFEPAACLGEMHGKALPQYHQIVRSDHEARPPTNQCRLVVGPLVATHADGQAVGRRRGKDALDGTLHDRIAWVVEEPAGDGEIRRPEGR